MTRYHYEVLTCSNQWRRMHIYTAETLDSAKALFNDLVKWAWSEVANLCGGLTCGVKLTKSPFDDEGSVDCDKEVIIKSVYYNNLNGNVIKVSKENI